MHKCPKLIDCQELIKDAKPGEEHILPVKSKHLHVPYLSLVLRVVFLSNIVYARLVVVLVFI